MTNDLLPRRTAVLVFAAFACAYFLSTLLRAITATLSPTRSAEFGLQARDLGLLAGGYFLGFSLTQLPMGRWLDSHGPKKVVLRFFRRGGCGLFFVCIGGRLCGPTHVSGADRRGGERLFDGTLNGLSPLVVT